MKYWATFTAFAALFMSAETTIRLWNRRARRIARFVADLGDDDGPATGDTMTIEYWKSAANGQWYFHLVGGNGEPMFQSEGYTERRSCLRAIERLKAGVASAKVELAED